MSRLGKIPIELPENVSVEKNQTNEVLVKGPLGELRKVFPEDIFFEMKDRLLYVRTKGRDKRSSMLLGTFRSHLANMVKGVSSGWKKDLEIIGTGYRAEVRQDKLVLQVGFSHPVEFEKPQGINFKVDKNIITVEGIDKELVGQTAARIRAIKPPEPYKGKGIKYVDEIIRRKAGKAAKAGAATA